MSFFWRMTILGSREQTCIHPKVREAPNRNEECKSLLRNEYVKLFYPDCS